MTAAAEPPRSRAWLAPWLLAAAVPLAFYAGTAAPGLAHADQAIAIDAMCSGSISAAATHHSLTALLGYAVCHAADGAGLARRANLLSAVLAALAVLAFLAAARRVMPWAPAVLGALYLMTSHSMWWHATVAEVYAANALVSALILYALVRYDGSRDERWLWTAAVAAGIGAFNHLQMGAWLPALLLAAVAAGGGDVRRRISRALRVSAALAVGLVPLGLAFAADRSRGGGLARAAAETAGGEFSGLFFTFTPSELEGTLRLFALQWGFPSLFWVFAAWGAWRLARGVLPATGLAAAAAFAVNTAFFAGYPTWDKFAFLLCSFVLATFAGALGLAAAWERYGASAAGRTALVAANACMLLYVPIFFRQLPAQAVTSEGWARYRAHELSRLTMLDGPYLANPDKHAYDRIERYAAGLAQALPPHATLVDHISATFFQLQHARRYRGFRPDVVMRAFVPPGTDVRRWPDGFGAPTAVAQLLEDVRRGPVFVTSIRVFGFHEIVGDLLDHDLTFVEHVLARDLSVYELVPGPRAVAATPVEAIARESAQSIVVRFVRRNPPLRIGVAWRGAEGAAVGPREVFKIPFDGPPVRLTAPPAAVSADLDAFGVPLGSVALRP